MDDNQMPLNPKRLGKPRLTSNRFLLAGMIATLVVAAIAILKEVEAPAVWAFLGLVITTLLGRYNHNS
jgi:hypothetical protein